MKLSEMQNMVRNTPPADQHRVSDFIRELSRQSEDFYQELEMDSRFVDTYQDISYPGANVRLHVHGFYELLYCTSAGGVEYLVGPERFRLQKGDLLFIPPGVSHCPILPEHMPEPYIRDVLWISKDFLDTVVEHFRASHTEEPRAAALLRTAGTRWESLGALFHSGVAEAEARRIGWEGVVVANTLMILVNLLRSDEDSMPLKAEKTELLDQVLAYIEQHLSQKITLADVAKHFYISESTITQTFRKKMGISFYRCVTQRRLVAAKILIEKGLPLEAAAEQAGFTDYSSFFRAFKQEYSVCPSMYKKLQGNRL